LAVVAQVALTLRTRGGLSTEEIARVFFFQAEDGIRDGHVTGVQTCALPISATANARPIALVNDQEQRELLFYYRNDSLGQERYKCLHLFYDQTHVTREGGLKLGGQVNMRNYASGAGVSADLYSAWSVTRAAGNVNVYLGYGGAGLVATAAGAGFVYRETGNVLPAFDPTMQYTLRRMYLAGAGGEFQMGEVYTYNVLSDTTSTQDWNCTPSTTKTNFAGAIAHTTKNH